MSQRYTRTLRLKRKADFAKVFRRGKRVSSRHLTLFYISYQGKGSYLLGVSASARIGTAVRRNRIKRLLRAAWQKEAAELSGQGMVVLIGRPDPNTPQGELPDFSTVCVELQGLLKRAKLANHSARLSSR